MLALALGGRTISEWQQCMAQSEARSWIEYYRLFPFDDLHRYHRPAALISTSFSGGDINDRLQWLAPDPIPEGLTPIDMSVIRAFGLKPPERND